MTVWYDKYQAIHSVRTNWKCAIMSTVDLTVDEEQPAPSEVLPAQPLSNSVSTSGPNPRPVTLPVSRIKTIMKSCPDTSMVSQEAAMLVTKSTVSRVC